MNPLVCGSWDGTNLWVQWDDVAPDRGYEIQVSYKSKDKNWEPWKRFGGSAPYKKHWVVIPTWREGFSAQVQIRVAGDETWTPAKDCQFLKSTCLFEISSTQRRLHYPAKALLICEVDGGACGYELQDELELQAGESKKVTLQARHGTAWAQLDHENHFDLRPALGVRIRNLAPSENDVELSGKNVTLITRAPLGPTLIAFGKNRIDHQ